MGILEEMHEFNFILENDLVEMREIAKRFFEDLITIKGSNGDLSHILSRINRCITEEANLDLTSPFTKEKVFGALKDMGHTKTLGIDVFTTIFF